MNIRVLVAEASPFRAHVLSRALQSSPRASCVGIAKSGDEDSHYQRGDRIFHQKFGYGLIRSVEGNKLTVDFDKAGEKRVIDSFVVPASAA